MPDDPLEHVTLMASETKPEISRERLTKRDLKPVIDEYVAWCCQKQNASGSEDLYGKPSFDPSSFWRFIWWMENVETEEK